MISDCLVSAVLMYTGAMYAGQVMVFCPAVVYLPVHRVPCVESHGFLSPAACLTGLPGKVRSVRYPLIRPEESFRPLLPCFVPGRVAIILCVFYLYVRDLKNEKCSKIRPYKTARKEREVNIAFSNSQKSDPGDFVGRFLLLDKTKVQNDR